MAKEEIAMKSTDDILNTSQNDVTSKKSQKLPQYFAAIGVNIAAFAYGVTVGLAIFSNPSTFFREQPDWQRTHNRWILTYIASSVRTLFVARFFLGLSSGGMLLVWALYHT
ncbi:hypothetical protein L9F63_011747, partial [Diploptera punctata]